MAEKKKKTEEECSRVDIKAGNPPLEMVIKVATWGQWFNVESHGFPPEKLYESFHYSSFSKKQTALRHSAIAKYKGA